MKTSIVRHIVFPMVLVTNGLVAHAQPADSVFVAGDDYSVDLYGGISAQEAIDTQANTFAVSKAKTPSMGEVYRNCAKAAGYKRPVEARARIYSSHFMAVSLLRGDKMTAAQFSTAIACAKRAAAPTVARTTTASAASAPTYASPRASFAVASSKLPEAQKIMARCVRSSGYAKPAQLQVTRYASDFAKIAMVRSGTMTVSQYEKSVTCMSTPMAAL
jgi:hypothetical protein